MDIARRCPLCGKFTSVVCDESAWDAYKAGALAQNAFPDMNVFDRETIISGMCKPCQMLFFFGDDEDEDDTNTMTAQVMTAPPMLFFPS